MEDKDKIVYVKYWKELVLITRTASGQWNYQYKISDVFDRLNKKRESGEDHYRLSNSNHMWEVGTIFGWQVKELIDRCKKSYGDEEA